MNRKGFGVEDTPFMILATVAVMMMIVWIGMGVLGSFVAGNEYQAAVEASTEIYKRAKLLSLGYDGSSDSVQVIIPEGYAVEIDGGIVALAIDYQNDTFENYTTLTEPLQIQGVAILADSAIPAGEHKVDLIYTTEDDAILVSW